MSGAKSADRGAYPFLSSKIVLTAAWFVVMFVSWQPIPPVAGLDPSYLWMLHEGVARNWRHGGDLLFSYGPLGFIALPVYHPGTYGQMLLYQTGLAATLGIATAWLLRRLPLWLFVVTVGCANAVCTFGAPYYLAAPILLILLATTTAMAPLWLLALLGLSAAGLTLVKINYGIAGIAAAMIADARKVSGRAVPWVAAMVLATTALLFVTVHPGDGEGLFRWAQASMELARGFNEAMQVGFDPYEMGAFLLLSAAGLSFLACSESGPWTSARLLRLAGFAVVLFLAFKSGFVRHDLHLRDGFSTQSLAFLLAGSAIIAQGGRRWAGASLMALAVVSAALCATAIKTYNNKSYEFILARIANRPALQWNGMVDALTDPNNEQNLKRKFEDSKQAIRSATPLPKTGGTVDIFPWDAGLVLAHEYDLKPRPVFQSYTVYTEKLIDSNVAFMSGDAAPDAIYYGVSNIDGRYPNMQEGALFPVLLSRYRPVLSGRFLLAEKRAQPLPWTLGPETATSVPFGVDLPVPSHAALWARIDVRPTALGKVLAFLYRAPVLTMTARFDDGREQDFRIVPAEARKGFIIDPCLFTTDEAFRFWNGQTAGLRRVTAIRVTVTGAKSHYENPRVSFQPFEMQRSP